MLLPVPGKTGNTEIASSLKFLMLVC